MEQGHRLQAWYDQLSPSEREEADYVLNALKGDFADAYLAVKLHKLEKRSAFTLPGWKETAAVGAAILAALGFKNEAIGG